MLVGRKINSILPLPEVSRYSLRLNTSAIYCYSTSSQSPYHSGREVFCKPKCPFCFVPKIVHYRNTVGLQHLFVYELLLDLQCICLLLYFEYFTNISERKFHYTRGDQCVGTSSMSFVYPVWISEILVYQYHSDLFHP